MKEKLKELKGEIENLLKKHEEKSTLIDIVKAVELGKNLKKLEMVT